MYHVFWLPTWKIGECITLGGLHFVRLLNVSHFLASDLENCQMYHTWMRAILAIAECITLFGSRLENCRMYHTWRPATLQNLEFGNPRGQNCRMYHTWRPATQCCNSTVLKRVAEISLQLFLLVEFVLQGRAACHTFVNS